jgi:endoglucanase
MDGALGGMDYLLGRNAMDYSYVTGYGTHAIEYPHHRFWAWLIDNTFPKAPDGVMCGGPNSGMQDPWVQGSGWKKGTIAPQKCYLDHIEAWSVNECTINWNASLAWLTSFVAQENGGIEIGAVNRSEKAVPATTKAADDEDEEDTTTTKKTTKSSKTTTTESSSESSDKKADLGVVALIAGAVIVGLISIELFVYKLIQMKKNNK